MTKTEKHDFKINEIYGIRKNDSMEWVAFNRDYTPLGTERKSPMVKDYVDDKDFPLFGLSKNIKDNELKAVAWDGKEGIKMHEGSIEFVFLYADNCSPWLSKKYLDEYYVRLKKLNQLASSPS